MSQAEASRRLGRIEAIREVEAFLSVEVLTEPFTLSAP